MCVDKPVAKSKWEKRVRIEYAKNLSGPPATNPRQPWLATEIALPFFSELHFCDAGLKPHKATREHNEN